MKKLIFLVVLVAAPDVLQAQSLEKRIEAVTGSKALDCGRLGIRASEQAFTEALRCGLKSAKQGKAFRITKQEQGIDSMVMHGLLGKPDGTIFRFSYDSDVSGGILGLARFSIRACPSPKVKERTFEC